MLLGVVAALGAAVAFGVAALLQALAARQEELTASVDPRLLLRMLRHPQFAVAIALNLTGFGLHVLALRSVPLFLAQATIGASVVVTALLSARVLGTPLRTPERWAVVAVVAGLGLLGAAAGETGETTTTTGERAWLLAVVAVLVVLGALAGRAPERSSALLLGLVSGAGFAVVAISGRLVPELDPAILVGEPAVYALLLAGGLAFLLYSSALQRGAAVTSTAAMVLGQTAGPALVGVLALGDTVRSGWGPVAILGLALAGAGAGTLARFDPQAMELERAADQPPERAAAPSSPGS